MESYLLAAVIISGIALLVNAFASLGIYRSVRKLQQDVAPLIPEVKATLLQAQSTLADTARDVREVTDRAREVLHSAQAQLDYFDQAKGEMITHLKVQSERVGVGPRRRSPRCRKWSVIHGTVLRPVREVSGIVSGVKAAVRTFLLAAVPPSNAPPTTTRCSSEKVRGGGPLIARYRFGWSSARLGASRGACRPDRSTEAWLRWPGVTCGRKRTEPMAARPFPDHGPARRGRPGYRRPARCGKGEARATRGRPAKSWFRERSRRGTPLQRVIPAPSVRGRR